MIWIDQASLLKAVNQWLEKSPNLFPNHYAFSLGEPNARLRGSQRYYQLAV
ncbi:hypothetical protein V4F52_004304 [Vibrio vulnificus]